MLHPDSIAAQRMEFLHVNWRYFTTRGSPDSRNIVLGGGLLGSRLFQDHTSEHHSFGHNIQALRRREGPKSQGAFSNAKENEHPMKSPNPGATCPCGPGGIGLSKLFNGGK